MATKERESKEGRSEERGSEAQEDEPQLWLEGWDAGELQPSPSASTALAVVSGGCSTLAILQPPTWGMHGSAEHVRRLQKDGWLLLAQRAYHAASKAFSVAKSLCDEPAELAAILVGRWYALRIRTVKCILCAREAGECAASCVRVRPGDVMQPDGRCL